MLISNRILGQLPFALFLLDLSFSANHLVSELFIRSSGMEILPRKSFCIMFTRELSCTLMSRVDVISCTLLKWNEAFNFRRYCCLHNSEAWFSCSSWPQRSLVQLQFMTTKKLNGLKNLNEWSDNKIIVTQISLMYGVTKKQYNIWLQYRAKNTGGLLDVRQSPRLFIVCGRFLSFVF